MMGRDRKTEFSDSEKDASVKGKTRDNGDIKE